jgi:hypothetical protein
VSQGNSVASSPLADIDNDALVSRRSLLTCYLFLCLKEGVF